MIPALYEELHRLAEYRMAAETTGHTLQPTALLHEAYLRVTGPGRAKRWDSRGHFFASAAEAMRRIEDLAVLSDGSFRFVLTGPPGTAGTVQRRSGRGGWENWMTFDLAGAAFEFLDPDARFYRAISP